MSVYCWFHEPCWFAFGFIGTNRVNTQTKRLRALGGKARIDQMIYVCFPGTVDIFYQ